MSLDTVLLRDTFPITTPAGSLNNTTSDSGHTRTVTDSTNKLSILGGKLVSVGSVGWGDPIILYPAITRQAGQVIALDFSFPSSISYTAISALASLGSYGNHGFGFTSSQDINAITTSSFPSPQISASGYVSAGSVYRAFMTIRNIGYMIFFKRPGEYPLLHYMFDGEAIASYKVQITRIQTAEIDYDNLTVAGYWLPVPLASDGFGINGTSDGLGHAETSGVGSGGGGVAWTGATWSVSGGKAINTPTSGSELLTNGDMEGTYSGGVAPNWTSAGTVTPTESATAYTGSKSQQITNTDGSSGNGIYQNVPVSIGDWIQFSGYSKNLNGAGGKIGLTGAVALSFSPTQPSNQFIRLVAVSRATVTGNAGCILIGFGSSVIALFDNLSARKLNFSSLLSLHASSTPDVFAGIDLTVTIGTQAGLALNWDSSSNPQNGVIAYHDGTDAKLEKCVAGTWTSVISAAATYSTGARLVVSKIGTAYRLYYNNALVGSGTISDAGIVSNTKHGLFSTDPSNTLDNYTCYASGTGGEYATAFDIAISASGASAGAAGAAANATRNRTASGVSAGNGTASGTGLAKRLASGQSNGNGTASGTGLAKRLATGQSNGNGTATGATSVRRNVAGRSDGNGSASATSSRKRTAAGASAGIGTATIHNYTVSATISS